jgi:putative hydrolase of the HAD superfamily
MCIPAFGHVDLFPGARELLQTIRALGLRCIIVSNAFSRAGEDYQADFAALGVDSYIDAVVSSVDVGARKPNRAIFERAVATWQLASNECAVIGNSEHNDIEPAVRLGFYAMRVAIEEPPPRFTRAHSLVRSLDEAAMVLRVIAGR